MHPAASCEGWCLQGDSTMLVQHHNPPHPRTKNDPCSLPRILPNQRYHPPASQSTGWNVYRMELGNGTTVLLRRSILYTLVNICIPSTASILGSIFLHSFKRSASGVPTRVIQQQENFMSSDVKARILCGLIVRTCSIGKSVCAGRIST